MLNLSTDVRAPRLCDKFCRFGLTEIVLPLVIGGLTSVGVGAGTAAAIGAVAAPALAGAGIGAGVGGLTAAVTGGKVLKGMGYGALAGGALGTGVGALGAYAPETAASLGLGGIGGVPEAGAVAAGAVDPALAASGFGLSSQAALGTGGMDAAFGLGAPATAGGMGALEAATGLDPATAAAYGVPGSGLEAVGAGAADAFPGSVAVTPELIGSNPGGYLGTGAGAAAESPGALSQILKYGRLAGAAGQMLAGPAKPNYGQLPGPGTTAATRGPLFDQPLGTGYINRTPVQNYEPLGGDWYSYGTKGNQPSFFSGYNGLQFPATPGAPAAPGLSPLQTPLRMAHGGALARRLFDAGVEHGMSRGGALSRVFDTRNGEHEVRGAGGGQDDTIDAKLSPGEWVADANFVSAIGDGSNEEGSRRLYAMRQSVLREKGMKKTVPPKLKKPPLHYLKEAS